MTFPQQFTDFFSFTSNSSQKNNGDPQVWAPIVRKNTQPGYMRQSQSPGNTPIFKVNDFLAHQDLPPTRYKETVKGRSGRYPSPENHLPGITASHLVPPPAIRRNTLLLIQEETLPHSADWLTLPAIPSVPDPPLFRLPDLEVPRILGIAPSLVPYHTLWRRRYPLEIQLDYLWARFRTRFSWAEIPDSPTLPSSLAARIGVLEELLVLVKESKRVLHKVCIECPEDCVNCMHFVGDEVKSLEVDIEVYGRVLEACWWECGDRAMKVGRWQRTGEDAGSWYEGAPRIEEWEKEAYEQPIRNFSVVRRCS